MTGKQRKYLKGLAHNLKPVVRVGRTGVSGSLIKAVDQALFEHELIKVRMYDPEDKKAMAGRMAKSTGAELVGIIGHTAILYRPDSEEPVIRLPE
ncbi:MAG: ribosome assembly RNA-binding protein YhbY [Deltaproteobacteria bacterium]|nr:ribosome assembly RNA-binding protein YhbY [Deltaproteobacteria bacterium]